MKKFNKQSESFLTTHLGTIIFVIVVLVAALVVVLWASTAYSGTLEWLPFR
ncbi:MAG: hypothetical protein Q8R04_06965 [Nanoarchaeota archaeon]|nr:hypothetical protein [Nanoarchaeota archaeon]